MSLLDIIKSSTPPVPWAEGEKIPWNDPDFSRRMLAVHLDQDNDWASRRSALIETHVTWINAHLLPRHGRILDLGCGPGFYSERLAALGHSVVGIDFSPASIAYARQSEKQSGSGTRYILGDVRQADFGSGFDVVMMLFGELNVFRRDDALAIVERAHAALETGGRLLLETHTDKAVKGNGEASPHWISHEYGVFSDTPHLLLEEHFWDNHTYTATTRYWVIDAETGLATKHASTMQAYSHKQYAMLLREGGFDDVCRYGDMGERSSVFKELLSVYTARKKR